MDGSTQFTKGRNQNSLSDANVAKMVEDYKRTADSIASHDGVSLVAHPELKRNGFDLNIGRYVKGAEAETVDVDMAIAQFMAAQEELHEAETQLLKAVQEAGYA